MTFINIFEAKTPADTASVLSFIKEYLRDNNMTPEQGRFGGCFEFAHEFISKHDGAELWETWELPDERYKNLPLVLSYDQVCDILKANNEKYTGEVGWHGTHAVVVWRGLVFDAGGISTFDKITHDFSENFKNCDVHWIRTE